MKSDAMTRTFISAAVDKGFKDIERDPKRSVRQLVDLGTFFAKGRFQRYFFDIFGEMLRNEHSSYYKWIHDLVVDADQKQLKTFGMNLAYNSWTVGAKTVRALEQTEGHNVPWTIVFRMDKGGTLSVEMLDDVIRQGRSMGIYCYVFFCSESYSPLQLAPLFRRYRDCAFMAFLQENQVDEPLAETMLEVKNTLACIRCDNNRFLEKQRCCIAGAVFLPRGIHIVTAAAGKSTESRFCRRCCRRKHRFFSLSHQKTVLQTVRARCGNIQFIRVRHSATRFSALTFTPILRLLIT